PTTTSRPPLHAALPIYKHLTGTRGQLGRLFAMGADAWQISKRLPLLQRVEDAAIDGQTGTLTMTPAGAIHRQQVWAKFTNGVPKVQVQADAPRPTYDTTEPQIEE